MTTTKYLYRAQTTVSTIKDLATKRAFGILVTCLALLAPGIASAGKPAPSPDAGCVLLLAPDPNFVYTGTPFLVKLVRDPAYPGAFRDPTVTIVVKYPTVTGGEITQSYDSGQIPNFNVTYVETTFPVPSKDSGIAYGADATATIDGTVTELLYNKKGTKETKKVTECQTKTAMVSEGS